MTNELIPYERFTKKHLIRICKKYHKDCYRLIRQKIELKEQLKTTSFKIINCIKTNLCKQDEEYDKPIISPKFLSDILDQMAIDGFEEIKEND